MLSPQQVRNIFLQVGALRTGHFLLSSGRHSNEYWEKFWVLQYPNYVETLCNEIARRFQKDAVEVVLGPTTGGILLAYEVARQLGVRALYAEKEQGVRCLRRGLILPANTRTLIVDDVLTTGGATRECIELAQKHQAHIVGVAVLVDRSGGTVDLGFRLDALLTVEAATYAPDNCPLCLQKVPLEEPGTKRLQETLKQ